MRRLKRELIAENLKARVKNIKNIASPNIDINEISFVASHLLHETFKNIEHEINLNMQRDGLVGASWMVLLMVYSIDEQKIIATDICDTLAQNKSTTSRIVESLIEKNLLERRHEHEDRRKIYLHLTQAGRAYVEEKLVIHSDYQNKLWCGVDLQAFMPLLTKLWGNSVQERLDVESFKQDSSQQNSTTLKNIK